MTDINKILSDWHNDVTQKSSPGGTQVTPEEIDKLAKQFVSQGIPDEKSLDQYLRTYSTQTDLYLETSPRGEDEVLSIRHSDFIQEAIQIARGSKQIPFLRGNIVQAIQSAKLEEFGMTRGRDTWYLLTSQDGQIKIKVTPFATYNEHGTASEDGFLVRAYEQGSLRKLSSEALSALAQKVNIDQAELKQDSDVSHPAHYTWYVGYSALWRPQVSKLQNNIHQLDAKSAQKQYQALLSEHVKRTSVIELPSIIYQLGELAGHSRSYVNQEFGRQRKANNGQVANQITTDIQQGKIASYEILHASREALRAVPVGIYRAAILANVENAKSFSALSYSLQSGMYAGDIINLVHVLKENGVMSDFSFILTSKKMWSAIEEALKSKERDQVSNVAGVIEGLREIIGIKKLEKDSNFQKVKSIAREQDSQVSEWETSLKSAYQLILN